MKYELMNGNCVLSSFPMKVIERTEYFYTLIFIDEMKANFSLSQLKSYVQNRRKISSLNIES